MRIFFSLSSLHKLYHQNIQELRKIIIRLRYHTLVLDKQTKKTRIKAMLRETKEIIETAQNKPFLQPTIIIELKNKEVLDYDVELFRTVGVFPTLKRLVSHNLVEAVYFISHIPTEDDIKHLSQNKVKVEVHNVNSLFRVIPTHISDIITSTNRGRKSYE